MSKKRITFQLSDLEDEKLLKLLGKYNQLNTSDIVRMALWDFFSKNLEDESVYNYGTLVKALDTVLKERAVI